MPGAGGCSKRQISNISTYRVRTGSRGHAPSPALEQRRGGGELSPDEGKRDQARGQECCTGAFKTRGVGAAVTGKGAREIRGTAEEMGLHSGPRQRGRARDDTFVGIEEVLPQDAFFSHQLRNSCNAQICCARDVRGSC